MEKNIRVQEIIHGTVTQKCVRTNEPFERELGHDFFTVMQPVVSRWVLCSVFCSYQRPQFIPISNIENSVDAVRYETKRRSKRIDKVRSKQKVDEYNCMTICKASIFKTILLRIGVCTITVLSTLESFCTNILGEARSISKIARNGPNVILISPEDRSCLDRFYIF